ncbi:MAG: hypothetical protein AAGD35_18945 [Actinomycetota bacterium]
MPTPSQPFPMGLADLDVCHVDTIGRRPGRIYRIEFRFALCDDVPLD